MFTHALVWADIVADFTDQRPDDSTPQLCAQAALDTLPLGSQHLASGVELAQIDGALQATPARNSVRQLPTNPITM